MLVWEWRGRDFSLLCCCSKFLSGEFVEDNAAHRNNFPRLSRIVIQ